jgi:hypothetical protein
VANPFLSAIRRFARARKAFLIAVAAMCLVLASAAAVLSSGPPWAIVDGVMQPDNRAYPSPTPHGGPGTRDNRSMSRATVTYSVTNSAPATYTFTRNGQPWITVTQLKGGAVELSDPNGSAGTLITVSSKHR